MSDSYTKLFSSIVASTIVSEPLATRWVWVTMLAMADAHGFVYASVPGLARLANVSREQCDAALESFLSPDTDSRTEDHEGRRIEPIDGGWSLLNHAKYRAMRSAEERREYMRDYMRKKRETEKNEAELLADKLTPVSKVSPVSPTNTNTNTNTKEQKHVQQAARFEDFWSAYPVKKGKAAAFKKWRQKRLDAIADQIIEHVQHMQAHDDDWARGYIPHGSTYVNGELWNDEPKRKPEAGAQQPSKTMQGIQALEDAKNERRKRRVDQRRIDDGTAKASLSSPGPDAGG